MNLVTKQISPTRSGFGKHFTTPRVFTELGDFVRKSGAIWRIFFFSPSVVMASPNAAFRQRHNQAAMSSSSTSSTASTSSSASHHSPSETTSATGSGSTAAGGGGLSRAAVDDDQEGVADTPRRGSAVEEAAAAPRLLRRSDTVGQIALMLSDHYIGESKPLLLVVPIAIIVACIPHVPDTLVFLLNAVALVPLAALNILTVLTMTRNARVWGGLLRAIGGNSTEFVVRVLDMTEFLSHSHGSSANKLQN